MYASSEYTVRENELYIYSRDRNRVHQRGELIRGGIVIVRDCERNRVDLHKADRPRQPGEHNSRDKSCTVTYERT
jgi:hypothetical protein